MTPDRDRFGTNPMESNEREDLELVGPDSDTDTKTRSSYIDGADKMLLSDSRQIIRTRKKIADAILVFIALFLTNIMAVHSVSGEATIGSFLGGAMFGVFVGVTVYIGILWLSSESKSGA